MAGEKKFGTSMFGFRKSDVNAYIERIIREFDQRLKEKDDENSALKAQLKDLRARYDQIYQESETLNREKEKIAGVLLQAQEKAETMMAEAQDKALEEKARLDQLLESEREKIVDIKRDLKSLRNQVAEILFRYQNQLDETIAYMESREAAYAVEDSKPEGGSEENSAI